MNDQNIEPVCHFNAMVRSPSGERMTVTIARYKTNSKADGEKIIEELKRASSPNYAGISTITNYTTIGDATAFIFDDKILWDGATASLDKKDALARIESICDKLVERAEEANLDAADVTIPGIMLLKWDKVKGFKAAVDAFIPDDEGPIVNIKEIYDQHMVDSDELRLEYEETIKKLIDAQDALPSDATKKEIADAGKKITNARATLDLLITYMNTVLPEAVYYLAHPDKDPKGGSFQDILRSQIKTARPLARGDHMVLFIKAPITSELFESINAENPIDAVVTLYKASPTEHCILYMKNKGISVIIPSVAEGRDITAEVSDELDAMAQRPASPAEYSVIVSSDARGRGQVIFAPNRAAIEFFSRSVTGEHAYDIFRKGLEFSNEKVPVGQTRGTAGFYANIDSSEEAKAAFEQFKAAGVGLYRTEYLFGASAPAAVKSALEAYIDASLDTSEDLLVVGIRETSRLDLVNALKAHFTEISLYAAGKPFKVRTVDFTKNLKDKPTIMATELAKRKLIDQVGESFDFYGLSDSTGVRALGKDILDIELEALCASRAEGATNIEVFPPMVSTPGQAKDFIAELERIQGKVDRPVTVGIMVENPEAWRNIALLVAIPGIKFYSLGSNDMTAGVMGMYIGANGKRRQAPDDAGAPLDRGMGIYAKYFSELNPEVLVAITEIMAEIIKYNRNLYSAIAAEHKGKPDKIAKLYGEGRKIFSVCGDLASWHRFSVFLAFKMKKLGAVGEDGVNYLPTDLSMPAPLINSINVFLSEIKESDYIGVETFASNSTDVLGEKPVNEIAGDIVEKILDRLYGGDRLLP